MVHIPGAPHSGGDTYLIKPELETIKYQNQNEFNVRNLIISITAVKMLNGKYSYHNLSEGIRLWRYNQAYLKKIAPLINELREI